MKFPLEGFLLNGIVSCHLDMNHDVTKTEELPVISFDPAQNTLRLLRFDISSERDPSKPLLLIARLSRVPIS